MTGDDNGLQRHRIIRRPEDGIVFEIDVAQCIGITSLRLTISELTAEIERADIRFIDATAQILFLKSEIKRLLEEIEALHKRMSDESDGRNRSMKWEG
jgi:hypothetical protein